MLRVQISTRDDPQAGTFHHAFDADRTQILIGRRSGVDVLLPDPKVSLVHARIERRAGAYLVSDENSTNGTLVNGVRLQRNEPRRLDDRDRIVIGRYELVVDLVATGQWRAEASSSLARRMVQEVLERLGSGESQPALHVLDGPQTGVVLRLDGIGRSWVLGRAGRGDLRLDDVDPGLERASLTRTVEAVTLRPLEPRPRLRVNSEPVKGARPLKDGDLVDFGGTSLKFVDPAEVYLRKLSAEPEDATAASAAQRRPAKEAEPIRAEVDRQATPRNPTQGRALELWVIAGALLVALFAIAALVWMLASSRKPAPSSSPSSRPTLGALPPG